MFKMVLPQQIKVTVTENKAPTDESVRLLNSLQEKALANLVKTVKVSNNVIDGVLFIFEAQAETFQRKGILVFKINGVEYKIENTYDLDNTINFSEELSVESFVKKIISELSKEIATHLFIESLDFWREVLSIKRNK